MRVDEAQLKAFLLDAGLLQEKDFKALMKKRQMVELK